MAIATLIEIGSIFDIDFFQSLCYALQQSIRAR